MLQLRNEDLDQDLQDHLKDLQQKIDGLGSFPEKKEAASNAWDGKSGSKANKAKWGRIKEKLISLCVGVELCNYCEQSEASDIEHVVPKGLFPEYCFEWENYLLACKNCNSGYKLDAIWIFDPENENTPVFVKRGTEPATSDVAFINPHKEDPLSIIELDFEDFNFYPLPKHQPGSREFVKWEKTESILELNERPSLSKYRAQTFQNIKRALREYVNVINAKSHQEIDQATEGNPEIDPGKDIELERVRILEGIKSAILKGEHPTVFVEMQRKVDSLSPAIKKLFEDSGALHWPLP